MDVLGQLPGMYQGSRDAESRMEGRGIFKKLHLIMTEVGSIGKDQKNTHQGFKFRGVDQFVNKIHPLLLKHQVLMLPQVINRQDKLIESKDGKKSQSISLIMAYNFIDIEDGSSYAVTMPSEGLDSGDKATNKAISGALKYALINTFMVPTEDMEEQDVTSPNINEDKLVKREPKVEIKTETEEEVKSTITNDQREIKRFKRSEVEKKKVVEVDNDDI